MVVNDMFLIYIAEMSSLLSLLSLFREILKYLTVLIFYVFVVRHFWHIFQITIMSHGSVSLSGLPQIRKPGKPAEVLEVSSNHGEPEKVIKMPCYLENFRNRKISQIFRAKL